MTRKSLLVSIAVGAALATSGGTSALSDDHGQRARRFKAVLHGFEEVPAVSTAAKGSVRLRISNDEDEIAWRLEYQNLQGSVLQSHIHVGDHHTNGGVSVFFCANNPPIVPPATIPAPQACPPAPAGGPAVVLTGTFTSADVAGPNAQLVAPGELAELIKAIRSGVAYANVHSTLVPSGEIRGELKADE
jgi:hypothetical protein